MSRAKLRNQDEATVLGRNVPLMSLRVAVCRLMLHVSLVYRALEGCSLAVQMD